MTRVVSTLELKALDNDERILEGWASRPESDRVGDIVESKGATYRLPLPLLMDHDHRAAVGSVISASVTDAGIRFKAQIAKIAEPGAIKDLCDSAWSAARAGLRRAVSIGFRPLESEPLAGGGMRFKRWEWFELSLVAVPACAGATLDEIKMIDRRLRRKANALPVVKLDQPVGVRAKHGVVRLDNAKSIDRTATLDSGDFVKSAIRDSSLVVEADLERMEKIKKLGPTNLIMFDAIATGARATDDALADLNERLKRLGG